ncbi:sugar ABC transporter ATP-binding protein [Sphingomonas humi]|uniref:Sugar ABC transporter ATP-binding protein n=1 Tax=Sphingomonas humi TaxID=335630 RepID=A0ABP7S461_9SPHN
MVAAPLLSLRGLEKVWPNGTVALRGVSLDVRAGSVHGLLGANGAGKSTLIKVLAGAVPASGGTIIWRGEPVRWTSPRAVRAGGIVTIYQHIPLVPTLSVLENLLLEESGAWRHSSAGRRRAGAVARSLGDPFDLDAIVGDCPIGTRQMVAIAKGLMGDPALLIMDEPTASLAMHERAQVYRTVRTLAQEGRAILFVSHFLDEIVNLTDEVTVLRDGQAVLRAATTETGEQAIAEAIAGRSVTALERQPRLQRTGATVLQVEQLASPGKLSPTSLCVCGGEIVGVAGMLGSGRSELLHAIFGADRAARGRVAVDGQAIEFDTSEAVVAGIALVPEDRAKQGLVGGMSISDNLALPCTGTLIDVPAEYGRAETAIEQLAIKASGPGALVGELSGGNAQKVTIARWLKPGTRVLLLDEPTAGIDIGARTDILRLVRSVADDGLAVILVSSELSELIAVADRILVMRDGAVIAEVDPAEADEADLVQLAGGSRPAMEMVR